MAWVIAGVVLVNTNALFFIFFFLFWLGGGGRAGGRAGGISLEYRWGNKEWHL